MDHPPEAALKRASTGLLSASSASGMSEQHTIARWTLRIGAMGYDKRPVQCNADEALTGTSTCLPCASMPTGVITLFARYGSNSVAFSTRSVASLSVKKMKSPRFVSASRRMVRIPYGTCRASRRCTRNISDIPSPAVPLATG